LTEGLSQLKWNSFARGERSLLDFQIFDAAARTPLGGLKLLITGKGRCGQAALVFRYFTSLLLLTT
jgi:Protein of unknown function (DUF3176)